MAITISTLPPIYPVYSDNLLLNVSHTGATANHYYGFNVYMNSGLTDSFNYPANPTTYDATINLSTVLSTYFETSVYEVTTIDMFEAIPNSVVPYYVEVSLYTSGGTFVESGVSSTYYTFNGCVNMEEVFDMTDYLMNSGNTANFLTRWYNDRQITLSDYCYLSVLTGDYGTGYTSQFSGLTITRYQSDGTSSGITESYTGTSKAIVNIDLSPNSINANHTGFIDSNTLYYTVDEVNDYNAQQLKIELIKENKITKFYNFIYVNRLGGIDCFTAVKVSNDDYKITKEQLEQFVNKKTYYTDAERTTNIVTQFLSYYQADKLKELFTSGAAKLWFNSKVNDITITNGTITVPDRYPHNNGFIQYKIEFAYNYKNYLQQY